MGKYGDGSQLFVVYELIAKMVKSIYNRNNGIFILFNKFLEKLVKYYVN